MNNNNSNNKTVNTNGNSANASSSNAKGGDLGSTTASVSQPTKMNLTPEKLNRGFNVVQKGYGISNNTDTKK